MRYMKNNVSSLMVIVFATMVVACSNGAPSESSSAPDMLPGVGVKDGKPSVQAYHQVSPSLNTKVDKYDDVVVVSFEPTAFFKNGIKTNGIKPYFLTLKMRQTHYELGGRINPLPKKIVLGDEAYYDYYPGGSKYTTLANAWDVYWYGLTNMEHRIRDFTAGCFEYTMEGYGYDWDKWRWVQINSTKSQCINVPGIDDSYASAKDRLLGRWSSEPFSYRDKDSGKLGKGIVSYLVFNDYGPENNKFQYGTSATNGFSPIINTWGYGFATDHYIEFLGDMPMDDQKFSIERLTDTELIIREYGSDLKITYKKLR